MRESPEARSTGSFLALSSVHWLLIPGSPAQTAHPRPPPAPQLGPQGPSAGKSRTPERSLHRNTPEGVQRARSMLLRARGLRVATDSTSVPGGGQPPPGLTSRGVPGRTGLYLGPLLDCGLQRSQRPLKSAPLPLTPSGPEPSWKDHLAVPAHDHIHCCQSPSAKTKLRWVRQPYFPRPRIQPPSPPPRHQRATIRVSQFDPNALKRHNGPQRGPKQLSHHSIPHHRAGSSNGEHRPAPRILLHVLNPRDLLADAGERARWRFGLAPAPQNSAAPQGCCQKHGTPQPRPGNLRKETYHLVTRLRKPGRPNGLPGSATRRAWQET